MSKKIFVAAFIVFCLFASAMTAGAEEKARNVPVPVISQSFASTEVWPGQTWKIYLNASHPAGEMKQFLAIIDQPGVGQYPLSIIRIKKENRSELSGYLYLVTATPRDSLDFVNLQLTVYVQDRAGNFSQPSVFPLSIQSRYEQASPEAGLFKEEALGPIMLKLKRVRGGKGGRSS